MLVVLLLVTSLTLSANSEWVEISQQHYRKPLRGHPYPGIAEPDNPTEETQHSQYPQEEDVRDTNLEKHDPVRQIYYPNEVETQIAQHPTKEFVIDSTKQHKPNWDSVKSHEDDENIRHVRPKGNRIYLNHSLSEQAWDQNTVVSDNSKNFKLVHAGDFKIKTNITPEFSLEIYGTVTDMPELVTRNRLKEHESVSATIERVPNTGSVKRVQLSDTPVKAPIVPNSVSTIRRSDHKHDSDSIYDVYSDELNIKSDMYKNNKNEVINTSPVNVMKHDFSAEETSVSNYDRIIIPATISTREPTMPFDKYFKANSHKQVDKKESNNGSYRTKVEIDSFKEDVVNKVNTDNKAPVDTKITKNIEPETDGYFEEVTISNNVKAKAKQKHQSNANSQFIKERNTNQNSETKSGEENKINEKLKVNTMENVMKFMKVVAETITKNTRRGVSGKVRYLNELKETLLSSIKARIDAAWPDDTIPPARRRSRSAKAAARGHVEFPSSESALMTISFLTFAVFLIKLVLQVIQTYKNKTMMVAPLVVATAGRAVRKLRTAH